MKFKIVPVITGGEIKYRVIGKKLLAWWYVACSHYGLNDTFMAKVGSFPYKTSHWDSPQDAYQWIQKQYGEAAEIVDFNPLK